MIMDGPPFGIKISQIQDFNSATHPLAILKKLPPYRVSSLSNFSPLPEAVTINYENYN